MVWVQRSIWVVLTVFSITVLYVVFSGGVVDEDKLAERDRKEAQHQVSQEPRRRRPNVSYLLLGRDNCTTRRAKTDGAETIARALAA